MATHQENHGMTGAPATHEEGMSVGKIWKVFFYLLALTALEFFIALALVHQGHVEKGLAVNIVYIALTLMKAYYIVAYFMHLKFETFSFINIVSIVFVLIIYMIVLMLIEGNYLLTEYNRYPWWPSV
ncbi:MAG TPA: cytochrome C oxidase subunit IV family protein [Sphingobacteriaceae bacterium]|nr:cytochrome C oxidase subunit IV family protein [Sphingobacteriaceae bacterium]